VDEYIPAGYTAEWMVAWAGVKKGLSSRQIWKMLGTPLRRRVSVVDVWYYVSDDESGWVAFYDDQVILWRRP
jgi:outer membrane protein assembly factor BamE (lipoprotein component of BamABCDE complex)